MITIRPISTKFACTPGAGLVAIEREPLTPDPSILPSTDPSLPSPAPGDFLISCPPHILIKLTLILHALLNEDPIPRVLITRELRAFMHEADRATSSLPLPKDWLRHLTHSTHQD